MRWLNVKATSPLHLYWTSLHCHQSPRTSLHFHFCNTVFVFIFLSVFVFVFVFVSLTYQYLILPICLSWQYKIRKLAHYCCQARLFEKITRTSTFDNHPLQNLFLRDISLRVHFENGNWKFDHVGGEVEIRIEKG